MLTNVSFVISDDNMYSSRGTATFVYSTYKKKTLQSADFSGPAHDGALIVLFCFGLVCGVEDAVLEAHLAYRHRAELCRRFLMTCLPPHLFLLLIYFRYTRHSSSASANWLHRRVDSVYRILVLYTVSV